ncbi:MAG: bifunctional phosphopantothenoylcysteine decarboxylase/phosphopantothenate--cysteine ligase CoaBC [Ancrocorticia sp.]|jgi:phosphopantothenoylcysteine decarboxylase/phosphopantothenate--cysteine ligase|nr:bifunctional phosphopantothenoylcysteine decarboxylase/phosphopantothenate--cysteine ligase CoaBC [Ancrocorticia sp.]MCI1932216.1 bifunctional phosphopantothenoylcysteine decarboxylase/phosphopantothenate--cysteine ligase CoaBC [Ancrocorticia sp.]MCI2012269.1 bifunctional phosphopantothenoylcysteine decarboxylase/phosphopantothenate--cysteine ligase CoaBC [Ancrocorticia sp.]MCI2028910.1 bifunctional phosphopantothenoylcysteine decarboxylase/phosphopantothenate--cysteine ligase CoaBC [Ancrocor
MGNGNQVSSHWASSTGGPVHVTVGVTGGIAAYKACTLVRLLVKAGADVTVVPTRAALSMVGRTTWEALSGHPVCTDTDQDAAHVNHVRLGHVSDVIVVAPTTAHTLARIAAGMADDLLSSTILAARCPVVLVPAMHTEMWLNPATQHNVGTVRGRGITVIEPASGRLTGADSGPGRMPEPEEIFSSLRSLLADHQRNDFAGVRFAISAGGTREPIDPVRFIGNRSSGAFGAAIARHAVARGANVTFVAAHVLPELLRGLTGAAIVQAGTAAELKKQMETAAATADVVIMAAAVADYRPEHVSDAKVKKRDGSPITLTLVENPDILAGLACNRSDPRQTIVGFAAETGDAGSSVLEYGRRKAAAKQVDLMVINEVGEDRGFGDRETAITIVDVSGAVRAAATGTKDELAETILDTISAQRGGTL